MVTSRGDRLREYLARLGAVPAAASYEEAYGQICAILNAVEDELTDIPYEPSRWQSDGRLYPPQEDSIREVAGHANIRRLRTRGHNVFISVSGAIEVRSTAAGREVVFHKNGADGSEIGL